MGAGQDEVDIARTADTTVLVLAPGTGDAIQSMKAGIMEIADIYVINMADREGADQLFSQMKLRADQDFDLRKKGWNTPVLLTATIDNEGIANLADAMESHRAFLMESGLIQEMRRERAKNEVLLLLKEELTERMIDHFRGEGRFEELIENVASRREDPYTTVREIIRTILPGYISGNGA